MIPLHMKHIIYLRLLYLGAISTIYTLCYSFGAARAVTLPAYVPDVGPSTFSEARVITLVQSFGEATHMFKEILCYHY